MSWSQSTHENHPIEAYAYCHHLSFPCCFHHHFSFLYSFSWQPFSLQLSNERHFEMQVDQYNTTAYFHLDVDKSSTTSYHTVQTAVTMTISFLPPQMTKHLKIMLIRSRRISLFLSSWTHATMIVIGGHLFLLRDVVWNVGSRRTGASGMEQWPAASAASRELFRWEHHISKASQWQHSKYLPFEKMMAFWYHSLHLAKEN